MLSFCRCRPKASCSFLSRRGHRGETLAKLVQLFGLKFALCGQQKESTSAVSQRKRQVYRDLIAFPRTEKIPSKEPYLNKSGYWVLKGALSHEGFWLKLSNNPFVYFQISMRFIFIRNRYKLAISFRKVRGKKLKTSFQDAGNWPFKKFQLFRKFFASRLLRTNSPRKY